MLTEERISEPLQGHSLAQRRDFLKLTLVERRKRLAAQADRMASHYDQASEQAERSVWQGGDIVAP